MNVLYIHCLLMKKKAERLVKLKVGIWYRSTVTFLLFISFIILDKVLCIMAD